MWCCLLPLLITLITLPVSGCSALITALKVCCSNRYQCIKISNLSNLKKLWNWNFLAAGKMAGPGLVCGWLWYEMYQLWLQNHQFSKNQMAPVLMAEMLFRMSITSGAWKHGEIAFPFISADYVPKADPSSDSFLYRSSADFPPTRPAPAVASPTIPPSFWPFSSVSSFCSWTCSSR